MKEKLIKNSRFQQAGEELKFIHSWKDLKIELDKVVYLTIRSQTIPGLLDRHPLNLQIEPTNYCNVDCATCSAPISRRSRGFMNFDLFTKIIDDAQNIGVRRILLYLHGEPLLHPRLADMARYIKDKKLRLTLYSNGKGLSEKLVDQLLRTGLDCGDYFTFSFLGHSKWMHEKIMKGVNHEKVVENIMNFLETRAKLKKNGPIIVVIYQLTFENRNELPEFFQYWNKLADHVLIGDYISYAFSREKDNPSLLPARKKTCSVLWDRLTIFWNGDVTMCCVDTDGRYVLGNLEKQTLAEVWNSEALRNIKYLHKKKEFTKIPICANCDM